MFGGLPAGFDEIAFVITTGNFVEGSIACLDSCYFPTTGTWMWSTGVPSWDGPHCFSVETPCYPPVFDYCVDSLTIVNCYYFRQFSAHNDSTSDSTIRYALTEGTGAIDEITGLWQYIPLETDYGTTQTLTIKTYNSICPSNYNLCSKSITFVDSLVIGDTNFDCFIDIADLYYFVAFLFLGGPPPINYITFDVNSDGNFDIADLIFLVNYMFYGDPTPTK